MRRHHGTPKLFHEMRVCEPTLGSEDDAAPEGQPRRSLIQYICIHVVQGCWNVQELATREVPQEGKHLEQLLAKQREDQLTAPEQSELLALM